MTKLALYDRVNVAEEWYGRKNNDPLADKSGYART